MLYILGKWATKVLKPASSKVSTYLRDSNHLIEMIESAGEIEEDEFIFAADTVAMCPNIDRDEAIAALIISFETNLVAYNKNLPIKLLVKALQLLKRNNVFRFGNTFYRQRNGAAIGMPPASDMVTEFFAFYEDIWKINLEYGSSERRTSNLQGLRRQTQQSLQVELKFW